MIDKIDLRIKQSKQRIIIIDKTQRDQPHPGQITY